LPFCCLLLLCIFGHVVLSFGAARNGIEGWVGIEVKHPTANSEH
jgi:hypothetical protein